jgi:hypothetical protein
MSWLGRLSDLTSLSKLGIGVLSQGRCHKVDCHKVDKERKVGSCADTA